MKRIVTRSLFVVACLITLIAALYVIESMRGERAWRAYKTAAQARGTKLYLAEYLPPTPADDDNFAAIPLFRDVFAAAQKHQPQESPFALPTGSPPKLSDHTVVRRIDLAEWQHFLARDGTRSAGVDESATALLSSLERYAEPERQLRNAAARTRTRFGVRWEDGLSALLPHLAVLRDAARINVLRLEAHLAQHNSAAAYDDFRFGLRLADSLRKEPLVICGLVRNALLQLLGNAVWNGLAADAWDDESLRGMLGELAKVQPLRDWQFALNSERGAMNAVLDELAVADGPERARVLGNALNGGGGPVFGWRFLPTGWLRQNQIWLNGYADETLKRIDPLGQSYARAPMRASPDSPHSFPERLYYTIACLIAPAYERIEEKYLATHTFMQQLRIACALEHFRDVHKQYPPQLDALVPDFLDAPPRDVIDGQPLRFRLIDGGRYVLYSIGYNGIDDGGARLNKTGDEQLDWVWQYPPPASQ